MRYSPEVVEFFKATGEGWQARIDGVRREHVACHRGAAEAAGRVAEAKNG